MAATITSTSIARGAILARRGSAASSITRRALLRSSTLVVLSLTLMLNAIWIQTTSGLFKVCWLKHSHFVAAANAPLPTFQAYGLQFVGDDHFLATVNSMAAAVNCASRVLWGQLADKVSSSVARQFELSDEQQHVRTFQSSYQTTMTIACSFGAALMWMLPIVRLVASRYLYAVWIGLMFSCIGATYSLVPFAVHKCFGAKNFPIAYGVCRTCLVSNAAAARIE